MINSINTFNDTKILVEDLKYWDYIVYSTAIDSTIETKPPSCRPFKLAVNTQHYFNKVQCRGVGVDLMLYIGEKSLSVLHINQPIKRCIKTFVSNIEARYEIEIENCRDIVSLCAIKKNI